MSETLEQVMNKRGKMANDMCDNILSEVERDLDADRWTSLCEVLEDKDQNIKKVVKEDAKTSLAMIKAKRGISIPMSCS